METCPSCEAPGITTTVETVAFAYGTGVPVILEAEAPVFQCTACGGHFTDYRYEEAQAAAVREHLKAKETAQ